jgi:hypothetical protein
MNSNAESAALPSTVLWEGEWAVIMYQGLELNLGNVIARFVTYIPVPTQKVTKK